MCDRALFDLANWLFGNEWRRAIFIAACVLFVADIQGGPGL